MAKLVLTVPVTNEWPERGGSAIKRIKTSNRRSMKSDLLNAMLMILINDPACNTTANTLITQASGGFQDKKPHKKQCSFQKVIKSKSMGTQVSINEEVPAFLLLEREGDSVISSVKTEVSKYELATNLATSDSDNDLDMDDDIFDVGNNF